MLPHHVFGVNNFIRNQYIAVVREWPILFNVLSFVILLSSQVFGTNVMVTVAKSFEAPIHRLATK